MCSSKLWETLQRELMNHSKLPRMTRTPLGFCPKNIQKLQKNLLILRSQPLPLSLSAQGNVLQDTTRFFCSNHQQSSSTGLFFLHHLRTIPWRCPRRSSTIDLMHKIVRHLGWATNPRWSEPSLNLSNDGIWSTYLDWWWSHLSQYESHLGDLGGHIQ